MKRISDSLLPLAEARAVRLCGRADTIDIDVEELDIAITLRAPSPTEYAEYIPHSVGAMRGTARYNLVASCLAYPCDDKAEPDLDALAKALDEIPALLSDLTDAITELATAEPYEVIDVSSSAKLKAAGVDAATLPAGIARVVILPAGAPVRRFYLRKPSRVAWEDYADGSGLDKLCEKAYALANDCIAGITDDERLSLLRWAPGLAIVMATHLAELAGTRRGEPRKKARRGSSASSAPTPNTQGSA